MTLALLTPGLPQLLIVLVVVLIVFGPKRLPALGRQIGKGISQLRSAVGGDDDEDDVRAAAPKPVERAPADPVAGRRAADEETVTAEPVDAPRRKPRD
jgi:sec-independent protein translocase protein TatA